MSPIGSSSTPVKMTMSQEDHNALLKLPGNTACVDCGSHHEVQWASLSYGILFCTECSASLKQRVGARFRSINVGTTWSQDNLKRLQMGGNERFQAYLELQGIDFAKATMEERYTSSAANCYHEELKAKTSGSISEDSARSVQSAPESSKSLFHLSRSRANTEEEDPLAVSDPGLLTRFIQRQPATSLDAKATLMVRQCLEQGKQDQSMLYRWTAEKMLTPTVTHMGRKYHADGDGEHLHLPSRGELEESAHNLVHRMGLSWNSGSHHSTTSEDSQETQAVKEYLRDLSTQDFAELKLEVEQLREENAKLRLYSERREWIDEHQSDLALEDLKILAPATFHGPS